MKIGSTAIAVVLDKSSSMDVVRDGTIKGFNEFLEAQKKAPGEASITLALFSAKKGIRGDDNWYSLRYLNSPLVATPPLTRASYEPDGNTALLDAVAKTIDELGARLAELPEDKRPEKVIVLIITDGEENSSIEHAAPHGWQMIADKIKHQEEKYQWQFVYMGAGASALAQAHQMGIPILRAAAYSVGNEQVVGGVFDVMNANVARARSVSGQNMGGALSYSSAQRASLTGDHADAQKVQNTLDNTAGKA